MEQQRQDYRAGVVAALIRNQAGGQPVMADAFFPSLRDAEATAPRPVQSVQEQMAIMDSLRQSTGGRIIRSQLATNQ